MPPESSDPVVSETAPNRLGLNLELYSKVIANGTAHVAM